MYICSYYSSRCRFNFTGKNKMFWFSPNNTQTINISVGEKGKFYTENWRFFTLVVRECLLYVVHLSFMIVTYPFCLAWSLNGYFRILSLWQVWFPSWILGCYGPTLPWHHSGEINLYLCAQVFLFGYSHVTICPDDITLTYCSHLLKNLIIACQRVVLLETPESL